MTRDDQKRQPVQRAHSLSLLAWAREALSAFFSRVASAVADNSSARVNIETVAGIEHLTDARWQLTETESRLRELLDNQTELIVRRDAKGQVMFANRAFCEAFGVEIEAIQGRPFKPAVLAKHRETSDHDQRESTVEQLETSAGVRWIQWADHRVMTAAGALDIQSVGRDVTDERRREAELREARDQADAANRAKSRFLAAMSHEIRTPMNGILGMASLLQETELSREQQTYTHAIDHSAKSLLALIDEILDFSKIEAGKLQLTIAPFSLRDCVANAIELMSPNASMRGNRLATSIAGDVPNVMLGDAARVRQIILNLVSNAVKFTEQGDIDVVVRRAPNGISKAAAAVYEVIVKDTGIGFSEDAAAVLFHEFEQADDPTSGRQNGTGLGLAISKRLARAMDGDIRAEGVPGKGATFTVTLKLCDCTVEQTLDYRFQSPPLQKLTYDGAAPPRILIAEDNEINALLARRMCESSGCAVVVVTDGLKAVDAIAKSHSGGSGEYQLILMDVFMPHLDGLGATRAIKALYAARTVAPQQCPPIVALTANAFSEDRDSCIAAGMDDYLAKPFDAQQLRAVLHRWLPASETRRAG